MFGRNENSNDPGGSKRSKKDASSNSNALRTNIDTKKSEIADHDREPSSTRISKGKGTNSSHERRSSREPDHRKSSDYFRTECSNTPGGSAVKSQQEHQEQVYQNTDLTAASEGGITLQENFGRFRAGKSSRGAFRGAARGTARRPQGLEYLRQEVKHSKPSPGHYGNIPGLIRPPSDYTERSRSVKIRSKTDSRRSNSLRLYPDLSPTASSKEVCETPCEDNDDVDIDNDHFPLEIIKIRYSRVRSDSLNNTFHNSPANGSRQTSGQVSPSVLSYQLKQVKGGVKENDLRAEYHRMHGSEHHRYENSANASVNNSQESNASTEVSQQGRNAKSDQHRQESGKRNSDMRNEVSSPTRRTFNAKPQQSQNSRNGNSSQHQHDTYTDSFGRHN